MLKTLIWTDHLVVWWCPDSVWAISGKDGSLSWALGLGHLFICWAT